MIACTALERTKWVMGNIFIIVFKTKWHGTTNNNGKAREPVLPARQSANVFIVPDLVPRANSNVQVPDTNLVDIIAITNHQPTTFLDYTPGGARGNSIIISSIRARAPIYEQPLPESTRIHY